MNNCCIKCCTFLKVVNGVLTLFDSEYRGRTIKVIDYAKTTNTISTLDDILEVLDHALRLCRHTRDNAKALLAYS